MTAVPVPTSRFGAGVTLFAVFAFAFYTHAFDRVLSGNGNSFLEVTSSPLVQFFALLNIYLAGIGHILLRRPKRLGIETYGAVALVLLCLASAFWSADPSLTFKRSISVAGALLTLSFLYRALGPQKLWETFVLFSAGFVVVQMLLMLAAPSYAFHNASDLGVAEHAGRFRGFYFHKNEAARLGLMALLVLGVSRHRFTLRVWIALMGCASVTLLATQSSKVIAALCFAMLFYWFLTRRMAPTLKLLLLAYLALMAGLVLALMDVDALRETFAQALGRDASFSGRDVLWTLARTHIQENFFLGGGFYAGWPQSAVDYLTMLKGPSGALNHAHNGYLQLTLDLGVIGLALTLFPSLLFVKRLFVLPRVEWTEIERFGALFVGSYYVLNMAGSYLLINNDMFYWLVLFLAVQARRDPPEKDAARETQGNVI
jgi:O-antigen ligase